MATTTGKTQCVTCGKEKVTYKCEGCSQNFCVNHVGEHHQSHIKQLDDLENQRNLFRQTLLERSNHPQQHRLIQQIDQWETNSINKIQRAAQESRQLVLQHVTGYVDEIEMKLRKLTEELKRIRQEDDFNEIHINQFQQKLQELEEQLNRPTNISLREEDCSGFVNKMTVLVSSKEPSVSNLDIDVKWIQNGITVAGGNRDGNKLNQLDEPFGVCIDDDQTIYVADYLNHRIVEWKKDAKVGRIVAGGRGKGSRNDQLNGPKDVLVDKENNSLIICDKGNQRVVRWPRQNGVSGETIISNIDCWSLAIDSDGYLYVSDISKHEVRRWRIGEKNGIVVAGGNGGGDRLNQLNDPRYIFVDKDHSVYVSDNGNNRVMKWMKNAKEGVVVAGGHSQGNALRQLWYPHGIIVDRHGTVYVSDAGNHRVVRWPRGVNEGTVVVGGNGQGEQANQFHWPCGLSFDDQYNLYVADRNNHRVQKFPKNFN